MGISLKIFQNGDYQKETTVIKKSVYTFSDCVFVTPYSWEKKPESIKVEFRIGEQARFLGRIVTIQEISLDSNQNIIYRVKFSNGNQISVQQNLLEKNNLHPIKSSVDDRNLGEEKEEKASPIIIQHPSVKPKENLSDFDFETITLEDYMKSMKTSKEESARIHAKDIFKFLQLEKPSYDLEKLEAILKIHKFLVQNSNYDEDIMLERLTASLEKSETDIIFPKTGIVSFTFQFLLSEIGIDSEVILAENKTSGLFHNAVLVTFPKGCYFFDVEHERKLCEKNGFYFSMAGLGIEEYNELYNVFGIFPQDGSDKILPLPNNVLQKRISPPIIKAWDRKISDLTYKTLEKKI